MNSEDTAMNEPANATNPGCTTFRLILVDPNKIIVGEHRRPLNPEKVAELVSTITATGFQPAPITIREVDGTPILVVGAHRLQAVKDLGWSEIPAFVFQGDERKARMWEIDENLRRAELTALERAEQIEEWRRLAAMAKVTQVAAPGGQQPTEAGIRQTSRDLGVSQREVERAKTLASLTDEAKAVARDLGLNDNQSALLDATKGKTGDGQIERLQQWKAKKSTARAAKAAGQPVEPVTPPEPEDDDDDDDDDNDNDGLLMGVTKDPAVAAFLQSYIDLTKRQRKEGFEILNRVRQDGNKTMGDIVKEVAAEMAKPTPAALTADAEAASFLQRPNVMKFTQAIQRAVKRCSPEERQFLCRSVLPKTLAWYEAEPAAPVPATADVPEPPAPEPEPTSITDVAAPAPKPVDPQSEDEPAPTTPSEPGDHVNKLGTKLHVLSGDRQKFSLDNLNNPEAAIAKIKGNDAWRDVNDFLTAFVASSPADQAAFRAQAQEVHGPVEPAQTAEAEAA